MLQLKVRDVQSKMPEIITVPIWEAARIICKCLRVLWQTKLKEKKKKPLKFNIMHPFSELMAFMLHKMA